MIGYSRAFNELYGPKPIEGKSKMNERIKLLTEQAGYTPLPGFDFANDLQEVFLNKFAELIVRECADVAYKYNRCDWADVSKSIKEHFGVEE